MQHCEPSLPAFLSLMKTIKKNCMLFKTRKMKMGDIIPSKALITKHSVFACFFFGFSIAPRLTASKTVLQNHLFGFK